jgi:hypothetical protein
MLNSGGRMIWYNDSGELYPDQACAQMAEDVLRVFSQRESCFKGTRILHRPLHIPATG